MKNSVKELAKIAIEAKKTAYAPYSGFYVGAALLSKSGKVYTGINIESASYSPTNCAERTALFKAISEGEREFAAIAIAGGKPDANPEYVYPCGVCRQMLNEFVDNDLIVYIVKTENDYRTHTFGELFPHGFGPKDLM